MNDETLPPNQQLVRGPKWPVVGEQAPQESDAPWTVCISGCVPQERVFSWEELRNLPQVVQRVDVHCVTRWSKLQMEFRGVPLTELIGNATSPGWTADAKFVSFVARSERNHSTSLPLDEVLELDPLVALEAEGKPLTTEHGGPVRMVVPGKYFYKSLKWLERIEFLAEDRLGYWEAESGYHNRADPWREERYMASTLSKQEATRVIESRDFRGRDLRGLAAANRNLTGLQAAGAMLRDADFRGAQLQAADFRGANLSNAHFQGADLRGASLENADLEGADLSSADLSGVNLTGASLFGTSFCEIGNAGEIVNPAKFDPQTRISAAALEALVEDQQAFVSGVCENVQ